MNIQKFFFPHDHKPHHIKSLDGLRGIAVLIVVVSHGGEMGFNLHPRLSIFDYTGNIGVFLFFLLSSFLLDRNIAIALINKKGNKKYWENYALRRFLRIYPLFAISLIIYFLLSQYKLSTIIVSFDDIIHHLLLGKGISFYWSIAVEFVYYLISPFILLLCHFVFKWRLWPIGIFLLFLIIGSIIIERQGGYTPFETINYIPIFLSGTFIAIVDVLKPVKIRRSWNRIGIIAIICIVLTVTLTKSSLIGGFLKEANIRLFFPYAIMTGVLLASLIYGNGILTKLMESKILRFLGAISFSLYLFHWVTIFFFLKYGTELVWLNTSFYYVISIIVATISYLLIEFPLSKINIKTFSKYKKTVRIYTRQKRFTP